MKYYIITGTSRGLGEAIAKQLIDEQNTLFCISRSKNNTLIEHANKLNCSLDYIEFDLLNVDQIDEMIKGIIEHINPKQDDSICLINNAGMVTPIKPIGKCDSNAIANNITLNTIAPMVITNELIKRTESSACKRFVINISSGAGKRPFYGWGTYCTSKAAVDMFTRCVGVEQDKTVNPVKIYSFGPGIVDTDMQQEIRQSDQEDFEQVQRFIKFKEDGELKSPEFVAKQVLKLIEMEHLENGTLTSIKEIMNH